MSHPDPRPPAADGERDLPKEIASAIEGLMHASFAAGSTNGAWAFRRREVAREALTTSILSRLTAAEAGREEAEARVEKLEKRVNTALDDACRMSAILLMAGEMSPQERRTAQAVANGLAAKVRAALTETQPKGDQ